MQLHLTLSYFTEPNPGRRGWRKRHRYASHGCVFDVKSPIESIDEFRKRLNERALDRGGGSAEHRRLGGLVPRQGRDKGSIHSDLADRGVIGVFPVFGWWKD